MKRKHKNYSRPKRPFEKIRIEEEGKIKTEFGLKNKREIWKTDAKVRLMREKAKNLISSNPEEQKVLFKGLQKMGLKVKSIADVLSLDRKDLLKRRLQTMVVAKKLATTVKQARQFIVHKKILIDGSVVNIPSYIVPTDLEDKITIRGIKKIIKKTKKGASSEESQDDEKMEGNEE